MFGAKLSWCQIVRCQIVLVPNCPGAKLSGAKLSGAKLSYHHSLNHFLSRLWCISAKCSISLLNDRLSFAPISGERLKKDRASVLNISSDAFPFLRLFLNQLRVSLFEGTRCSFTGRSILTDKWQSQMEKSQGTNSHFLKNFNPHVSRVNKNIQCK